MSILGLAAFLAGCSDDAGKPIRVTPPGSLGPPTYDYGVDDPNQIKFLDTVAPQPAPDTDLADLSFTNRDAQTVTLRDFVKEKNLVVVMTRGYNGAICPYCSAQTSRLIANYSKIEALGAGVVVIYPLEQSADSPKLADFLQRVNQLNAAPDEQAVPFPVLLDVGLQAVDILGIRKDLSKPATYILDRTGAVKFAYVGNSLADRPSVKAILEQLQQLQPKTAMRPRDGNAGVSFPVSSPARLRVGEG